MKKILALIVLATTQISFAAISESSLEISHQNVIEKAIIQQCGNFRNLVQVSTTEEVVQIDQGIRDVKYNSVFTGVIKIDQVYFDKFEITVESNYTDMYNHETKTWGVYSVDAVSCKLWN